MFQRIVPTDARGVSSVEKYSGRADIRHHFMISYPSGCPLLQWAGKRLSDGYRCRFFTKRLSIDKIFNMSMDNPYGYSLDSRYG
jgi:hypothetical protein